jgi:ABC-type sugar transport system permease subunit
MPTKGDSLQSRRSFLAVWKSRETRTAYLFLLPVLVYFAVMLFYPMCYSFYLSLAEWDMLSPAPEFVGLDNYREVFDDPIFWKSLKNTFAYVLYTVPVTIVLALCLALALNQIKAFSGLFRTAYFMPVITSAVVVSIIWKWLYQPNLGLINILFGFLHIPKMSFLESTSQVMPSIAAMSVWKGVGYSMVIFLAGLQDIPRYLYEAAAIDGASGWKLTRYITLPLLKNTTVFITVTSLISAFQVFTEPYILTQGGPVHASRVLVLYIQETAFDYLQLGYGAAMVFILFLIIMAITAIQLGTFRSRVEF